MDRGCIKSRWVYDNWLKSQYLELICSRTENRKNWSAEWVSEACGGRAVDPSYYPEREPSLCTRGSQWVCCSFSYAVMHVEGAFADSVVPFPLHFSICKCMCVQLLSYVQLSVTPWTAVHQASLSMVILQARMLEWVASAFSRGSSWHRNRTQVSGRGRWIFYHGATREDPNRTILLLIWTIGACVLSF